MTVPDATSVFHEGDTGTFDLDDGSWRNETTGDSGSVPKLPDLILEIISSGVCCRGWRHRVICLPNWKMYCGPAQSRSAARVAAHDLGTGEDFCATSAPVTNEARWPATLSTHMR
jgi:hypothetical protein